MKPHHFLSYLVVGFFVLTLGCQTVKTGVGPIKEMRLVERSIDGRTRIFSTFGFWVLDESLRERLLSSYDADGRLNLESLRKLVPEAQIKKQGDHVRLDVVGGVFPEILLIDDWLLALDPKADGTIVKAFEAFKSNGGRLPVVPIRRPIR